MPDCRHATTKMRTISILFSACHLQPHGHFFEIVLRSNEGTSYGGWLWGEELEILNEVVNGYRVLAGKFEDRRIRFEYSKRSHRYRTAEPLPVEKSVFLIQREVRPYAGRHDLPGSPAR